MKGWVNNESVKEELCRWFESYRKVWQALPEKSGSAQSKIFACLHKFEISIFDQKLCWGKTLIRNHLLPHISYNNGHSEEEILSHFKTGGLWHL